MNKHTQATTNQRGAVSVAAALSLTALMGAGAMAVDVGNVMVARNDIQNAVDAGALRGAGMLYNQGSSTPNFSMMTNGSGSPVYVTVNQNDPIGANDVLTVQSNYWQSLSPHAPSNEAAVQVSLTKQVTLFFGGILGMRTMNVSATATAIVQSASSLGAGGTSIPFAIPQCAISQYWDSANNQPTNNEIQVGPTHTCSGGSDSQNQNNQNQDNQNQNQNQDNQNQNQNQSSNATTTPHYVRGLNNPGHQASRLGNYVVDTRPHLVRSDFTLPADSANSALQWRNRLILVDHNQGADRNGSSNQTQGTGEGAGGPGNGNGPGQGAGQGLGSGNNSGSSGSCITGQFSTLSSQHDNGNFNRCETITQNGNPQDLHTGDSISLESNDYNASGNQNSSNSNQNQDNQSSQRQQNQSRRESALPRLASLSRSHSPWISPLPVRFEQTQPRSGFLRVDGGSDSGQGNNGQNQGNSQGNGDPYTSINNCSAAGNHACEYSIVPVVNSATTNGNNGTGTIVGFACLHILSATDGTVNAKLSTGCVSNTSSKASNSSTSQQTAWGVVSPPRLAQ